MNEYSAYNPVFSLCVCVCVGGRGGIFTTSNNVCDSISFFGHRITSLKGPRLAEKDLAATLS